MRIGDRIPSDVYDEWHFVEDDEIATKMRAYDERSRLAINVYDQQLAIAYLVRDNPVNVMGDWVIAAKLYDPQDNPLRPPTTSYILEAQRKLDTFIGGNTKYWRDKQEMDRQAALKARKDARRDFTAEKMDEYVALEGQLNGAMRPQSMMKAKRVKDLWIPEGNDA